MLVFEVYCNAEACLSSETCLIFAPGRCNPDQKVQNTFFSFSWGIVFA